MKPALKIFLVILAVAALGAAGFFLWKNNKTAPETADFSISPDVNVPTEFQLGDETIPLTWTDDNEGENLIIQSDQKYYDGNDSSEIYFSVTNASGKDQKTSIYFWFDDSQKKLEQVEKTGDDQISNDQIPISNKIPIPNFQNRKDIKGFTSGSQFEDSIASGATNFYKATIQYPSSSSGEFFVEAFGDKNAYGHLDPYFTSGLVGYWPFDGDDINWSTTTAYDRSGQGNNGTITNMSQATSPQPGKVGQGLSFDGSNDIVSVGSSNIEDIKTISYWIKTSANNFSATNYGGSTYYKDGVTMSPLGSELVTNGNFNSNINGWQLNTCGSSLSWRNEVSGDGSTGYMRFNIGNNVCYDRFGSTAGVTSANTTYLVSFWYRTSGITGSVGFFSVDNFAYMTNQTYNIWVSPSTDWKFVSLKLVTNSLAHPIIGMTKAGSIGSGTFDIDAVSVKTLNTSIDNNWHHIVTTSDNGIYMKNQSLYIGYHHNLYFTGLIDEVRVYDRMLSPDEIASQYRTGARKIAIDDWRYKKPITINGSTAGAQTNYQVLVTADTQTLISAGKMQSDGDDIRFRNADGVSLPYWIESGINTATTKIWVKVDSVPASPDTTTIYMYYGNKNVNSGSNGNNTFILFDDFSGASIDTNKWTVSGTWAIENGRAKASAAGGLTHTFASEINNILSEVIEDTTVDTTWCSRTILSGGGQYNALWRCWGYNQIQQLKTGEVSGGVISQTLTPNIDYKFGFAKMGSDYQIFVDRTFKQLKTNWLTMSAVNVTIYSESAHIRYFDNALVRKYVSPEPTAGAPGSEVEASIKKTKINTSLNDRWTSGLVGMWSFNGPDINWSTNTAYDRSGQGNNGTITNMSQSTSPQPGKIGQALNFDGSNDYVSMNHNFFDGVNKFTLSAWVKRPATNGYAFLNENMDLGGGLGVTNGLEIYPTAIYFNLYNSNASSGYGQLSHSGTDWFFITMVYDGTQTGNANRLKGFINGVQQSLSFPGASIAATAPSTSGGSFEVNRRLRTLAYGNGLIDEVRVYNRALSADEIAEQYRAGARKFQIQSGQ